ncbi:epoxide hydrolase 1-related [Holotrichia oblita]|uniref:Epoxide hydrolase 1-related n=1 Tax=Holotrichia oblita TaxID=644536 RepID=A0ACB9TYC9_HOLOL|nr:epoxide hydrolase 1-related [Holotrichia oblita]
MFRRLIFLLSILFVGFIAVKINSLLQVPPLPKVEKTWWGYGAEKEDTTIKPFKITFPRQVVEDLTNRLKNTRMLTPALEGTQQQYGINSKTLTPVLDYWITKYDFQARETYLNQFPQFKTNIQGLNIHFIHVKPKVPEGTPVLPLLILHGWPGSVVEFYKIIPYLTKVHEKYGFAFEVIAPSLPGFGFSDGAVKPGCGTAEISLILRNLMLRIGHTKFYAQGGDWGSVLVTTMATLFPENILGLHSNMPHVMTPKTHLKMFLGSFWPSLIVDDEYKDRMYPLSKIYGNLLYEFGYFHIQATKPDTIGVGINDSPAGLAAYILEKVSTATNRLYREREDGGLLEKFTYDELVDNLMMYWVPQSFTTAVRIYAEGFNKRQLGLGLNNIPISEEVPCAIAVFPNEIVYYPDWILRDKYANLVHRSNFKEGGHFAAMEVPSVLAEDVFEAVNKMRSIKTTK